MKKLILLLCIILSLISCTTTKYVEVPSIKTEYKEVISIDSIVQRDSILIKEKGDTCIIEKYRYLYKIKERVDTINITDTVTVVKQVEVLKEVNRLYTWQIVLIVLGIVAVVFTIYKIISYIRKWILV